MSRKPQTLAQHLGHVWWSEAGRTDKEPCLEAQFYGWSHFDAARQLFFEADIPGILTGDVIFDESTRKMSITGKDSCKAFHCWTVEHAPLINERLRKYSVQKDLAQAAYDLFKPAPQTPVETQPATASEHTSRVVPQPAVRSSSTAPREHFKKAAPEQQLLFGTMVNDPNDGGKGAGHPTRR